MGLYHWVGLSIILLNDYTGCTTSPRRLLNRSSDHREMAPSPKPIAIIAAVSVALCSLYVLTIRRRAAAHSKGKTLTENKRRRSGIVGAIGNTPLIRINSLSDATGCEVTNYLLLSSFM